MCARCDNFNKHANVVREINRIFLDTGIPVEEGVKLMLYMCGILCACPTDIQDTGERVIGQSYEPVQPEGWLKEEAWANIEAAYRRVLLKETQGKLMRKGGLN